MIRMEIITPMETMNAIGVVIGAPAIPVQNAMSVLIHIVLIAI